jgi:uncharacterized membrane protein YgcG
MLALPASSLGLIVFSKGSGSASAIWTMNDNGFDPQALVTPAQLSSASGDQAGYLEHPDVFPNGGTTVVFDAQTLDTQGGCGVGCGAIYSLAGGTLTRLSTPVVTCGHNCPNFLADSNPTITAQDPQQVLFKEVASYTGPAGCLSFHCYVFDNDGYGVDSVPLSGGTVIEWTTPTGDTTTEPYTYNPSSAAGQATNLAADPVLVSGRQLAVYTAQLSTPTADQTYCGSATSCDLLVIDDPSNAGPYMLANDDDQQVATAWSPSGQDIAAAQSGSQCGVWVYTATPAFAQINPVPGTAGTPNPTWHAYWVLGDPSTPTCAQGSDPFTAVTWLGNDGLVVADRGNLYSIPAACLSGVASASTTDANCTLASAGVTELTSTGDIDSPSWTSASSLTPHGSGGSGGGGGGGTGGGGTGAGGSTGGGGTSPTPAAGSGKVVLGRVTTTSRAASASITCMTGGASCAIIVQLQVTETRRGSKLIAVGARSRRTTRRTVIIGSTKVTLTAGAARTIAVVLNTTGTSLLAKRHTLHALLVVHGHATTAGDRVTFVERARRKRH